MSRTIIVMATPLLSYAVAAGEMSGQSVRASASSTSYAVATGELSGRSSIIAARSQSYANATAMMEGKVLTLEARPLSTAVASGLLGGNTKLLAARLNSYAAASATLTGASDRRGLSLCDVLDDILGMWGIFNRCAAPDFAKEAAINIVNASMQTVWNNAKERNYWSKGTLTLTFLANATSQELPDDIQNVVGPCRLASTRRPLSPIGTIGELESFVNIYLDGEIVIEPIGYHIERLTQVGGDPAKTVLHVTPAPLASTSLMLDVVREAPRYAIGDLVACPSLPIPHRYVESLLLPVARYLSSSFYLFRKKDQKETIDREYQQARIALGMADPLPGKAGDNKEGVAK